jgi:hypothetical protein
MVVVWSEIHLCKGTLQLVRLVITNFSDSDYGRYKVSARGQFQVARGRGVMWKYRYLHSPGALLVTRTLVQTRSRLHRSISGFAQ